jgi:hypothetical protein
MKIKICLSLLGAALLAAGCASYDGRGLTVGQATESDVVKSMGQPTEVSQLPNGDKALYYSRLPYGRQMYVATTGSDGRLKSLQQVLDYDHIRRIRVGTPAKEVRTILGPPATITRYPFKPVDVWEYPWQLAEEKRALWISMSDDGLVREIVEIHDHEADEPTGPGSMP